jgi:ABC-type enterobactin transport system permease subunit
VVRWRVPVRAYALAIGLPALISGLAVIATMTSGAAADPDRLGSWTGIPTTILVVLLIPGFGGA